MSLFRKSTSNAHRPRGQRYQMPSTHGDKAKTAAEKALKEKKFGKRQSIRLASTRRIVLSHAGGCKETESTGG